eukprot:529976_1
MPQSGHQYKSTHLHRRPRTTYPQAKIKRKLGFICHYSEQFMINQYHKRDHVVHSNEGKQQEQVNGCPWTGKYTELQHHVMDCRFKPPWMRKLQALESDNAALHSKIRAMERTMNIRSTKYE